MVNSIYFYKNQKHLVHKFIDLINEYNMSLNSDDYDVGSEIIKVFKSKKDAEEFLESNEQEYDGLDIEVHEVE